MKKNKDDNADSKVNLKDKEKQEMNKNKEDVEISDFFLDGIELIEYEPDIEELEITEAELDMLDERELTEDELFELVLIERDDYTNHEALVFNYKKLMKHIRYYYYRQKIMDRDEYCKNIKINKLKALLAENNISLVKEVEKDIDKLEESQNTLFTSYLRKGYEICLTLGTVSAENKEGDRVLLMKTDGGECPFHIIHKVIDRTPTHLIISVTEEQDDGSYLETDRYKITIEKQNLEI